MTLNSSLNQLSQGHLSLYTPAIDIPFDTEAGDECEHERLTGAGLPKKCVNLVREVFVICLGNFILRLCELHFADIDGLVCAVDNQVYLGTLATLFFFAEPAAGTCLDARNSEHLLDLLDVIQA